MPVVDQKLLWQDNDGDHHIKLVDRQRKNDNDTSPIFPTIPIGSAVSVQCEDGSLWTHGMVVDKGNHNHQGRAYIIQLTNNGRCISRNRHHIKPMTVMADAYLQHQSQKTFNKTADPLAEILNSINNNPALYATEQANTTTKIHHQYKAQNTRGQKEADIEQYHKETGNNQEKGTTNICEKKLMQHKLMKSLEQGLDILLKNQTGSHTYKLSKSPANMLASTEMLYG